MASALELLHEEAGVIARDHATIEELRASGFLRLNEILEHQKRHPIIEPLDLVPRLRLQAATAAGFVEECDQIEGYPHDASDTIMVWANLFAELFREICDRHRVHPEIFEEKFSSFQDSVGIDMADMKWHLGGKHGDVGLEGLKERIMWKIDSLVKNETGTMGVLLTLAFPHIEDGETMEEHSLEHAFFPYQEPKLALQKQKSTLSFNILWQENLNHCRLRLTQTISLLRHWAVTALSKS